MVWNSWSVIDNFTPELFTFGFDPEVLSCFWGLFRSSGDIDISGGSDSVRVPIPRAPFQLIVPFQNSDRASLTSLLQCAFATSATVLVVSLSSYGMYNILQSARGKFVKKSPSNVVQMQMMINESFGGSVEALNQLDYHFNPINHSSPHRPQQLQLEPSPRTTPQKQQQQQENLPVRPTSLSVSVRNAAASSSASFVNSLLNLRPFKLRNTFVEIKDLDLDLENVESMEDIQGEYFGPSTVDLDASLSFDDSVDSNSNSDYKTPCAAPYDFN